MNFCLNDGTPLIDDDSGDTLVLDKSPIPFDAMAAANALTKAHYSVIADELLTTLYLYDDYEELALDSRFARLIDRQFQLDPENCLLFIRRLIKRAEFFERKGQNNGDIQIILEALIEPNTDVADNILKQSGLL